MSYPKYFSYFPNLDYTVAIDKAGNESNIKITDYFHLLRVRDDIFAEDTIYEQYNVKNGQRPDQISQELYKDPRYFWIILQVNGIKDFHNEWPLSTVELDNYILKKYGSHEKANAVRHYETVETKDNKGNIVLKEGLKVSEDFVYEYPIEPGAMSFLKSYPEAITNRRYEYRLNETKSQIDVVDPKFVTRYEEEVREYYRQLRKRGNLKSELSI